MALFMEHPSKRRRIIKRRPMLGRRFPDLPRLRRFVSYFVWPMILEKITLLVAKMSCATTASLTFTWVAKFPECTPDR
jgi:hypothetical protein